jgi:hypothetical protein
VTHLKLGVDFLHRELKGTADVEWLHLLHQFSTEQTLHVPQELAWHVALALDDITAELVAKVLPSLQLTCLADQPASSIEKFIAVRQFSGRPVTSVDTEREFHERVKSYVSK